jgi:hypothetical protein
MTRDNTILWEQMQVREKEEEKSFSGQKGLDRKVVQFLCKVLFSGNSVYCCEGLFCYTVYALKV